MSTLTLSENARSFTQGTMPMLIGAEWVQAASGETFPVYDPATGAEIARAPRGAAEDVDRAVAAARRALKGPWKRVTPQERGRLLWRLADLIEAHLEDFSQIDSLDNGKPINEARFFDVPFTVDMLRYFAGWPTKLTGDTIPVSYPASFGGAFHCLHAAPADRRGRRDHALEPAAADASSRSSRRRWRAAARSSSSRPSRRRCRWRCWRG